MRVILTGDTEGLPRQCPLCRRPQSTIDANHRRHHSKPPFEATIEAIHRRQPSTPTSPYLTTHQILFTLGHHHKPNPRTHQLLLHVDNVNPSRASGSFSIQGLFRQRAYPVLKGGNFSITLHRFLLFRSVTQTIEATKSSEARAILAIGVTEAIEAIGAIGAIGATIKAIDAIAVISAIEVTLSSGALYAFRVNCFSKTAKSWNNCYRRHFGIQFSESRRHF